MNELSVTLKPSERALEWWRFASTMTTAISLSAAFAHLMEMPAKMRFDPVLYVKLHRSRMSHRSTRNILGSCTSRQHHHGQLAS
jgi:hypothetical protein